MTTGTSPEAAPRRCEALVGFLRSLGAALGTFRLHPETPDRPEVAKAIAKAAATGMAAADAAAAGDCAEAVIETGLLSVDGRRIVDDPHIERLAQACFERRIEHLSIHGHPVAGDIRSVLEVLLSDPETLPDPGVPTDFLAGSDVTAVSLRTAAPRVTSGRPDPSSAVTDPNRTATADPDTLEVGVTAHPDDDAEGLYRRLAAVHAALTEDTAGRSSFFREAAEAVDGLRADEQARFGRLILDRAGTDAFATRYLGHLTDLALATLTMGVASAEGRNPTDLARVVVEQSARHHEIVHLVDAIAAGDRGTAAGAHARSGEAEVVGAADVRELREDFPRDPDELQRLSLRSLRDYTVLEDSSERLRRVLDTVTERLGEACRVRDLREVEHLCAYLGEIERGAEAASPAEVEGCRRGALRPELITDLAVQAARGGDFSVAVRVLEPFGDSAVAALVDVLAESAEANVRGALVALLAELARARPARLRPHLDHPQWFVVRNVVAALGRMSTPDAVPELGRAGRHEHPAVRREAVRGLLGCDTAAAAATLAALAREADGHRERASLLTALSTHPHPEAAGLLVELGRGDRQPRLSWRLRRKARRLARERSA